MGRIRKVDRWEARRKAQFGGSNCEWVDWLPRSLNCAAANCGAAPVGMTELQTDRVCGPSTLRRAGGMRELEVAYGDAGRQACFGVGHGCGVDAGMEIWAGG